MPPGFSEVPAIVHSECHLNIPYQQVRSDRGQFPWKTPGREGANRPAAKDLPLSGGQESGIAGSTVRIFRSGFVVAGMPVRAQTVTAVGPVAYLVAFRCYGHRLHPGPLDSLHSSPAALAPPWQRGQAPGYGLDCGSRRIVIRALLRACGRRQWKPWAARARPSRVCTVVGAETAATQVLATLKAAATRAFPDVRKTPGRGPALGHRRHDPGTLGKATGPGRRRFGALRSGGLDAGIRKGGLAGRTSPSVAVIPS